MKLIDRAEHGSRDDRLWLLGSRKVAHDSEPEPGVPLDAIGEVLGQLTRPNDDHESRIAAMGAVPG